uniref:Uncharacterized protein n=1 Tax=Anguilla anguilla TaxID=7936 RepID=A0A0E9WLX0_ANGAN
MFSDYITPFYTVHFIILPTTFTDADLRSALSHQTFFTRYWLQACCTLIQDLCLGARSGAEHWVYAGSHDGP